MFYSCFIKNHIFKSLSVNITLNWAVFFCVTQWPHLVFGLDWTYLIFHCWFLDCPDNTIVSTSCYCCPSFAGMLPVLLSGLILALSISATASESATLRFLGQTDFFVNESSTTVVRLVVERVGDPVNVTALVLVRNGAAHLLIVYKNAEKKKKN